MVRTKVFVGNLSFQTKEAELASEFATAGKVISANIITRGPRSLGYGFVELDSEEDAQNAVKLMNKKEINGRPINVEIAKPQDETKEKAPRVSAEGENGAPLRRRPRRKNVRKEGEQGTEHQETEKDGKKEEQVSEGQRPRRRPRNKRTRRPDSESGSPRERRVVPNEEKEESKTTLFVANLPFSLDDDSFEKIVSDLSLKPKSAHVVKKRNGRSKGYGFIEFETHEDQQKALAALNKKVVDSRELSVKVALTELKKPNEGVEEQKEQKTPAPVPEKKTPAPASAPVAEKKTATPAPENKAPAAEKKAAPQSAAKETKPSEKKTASPAPVKEGKPSEKKAAPPAEKPTTPEKKAEEKK